MRKTERGAAGWVLLWLLGIPIPILLVLFLRVSQGVCEEVFHAARHTRSSGGLYLYNRDVHCGDLSVAAIVHTMVPRPRRQAAS